jgi:sialate O-acetylesterase
MAASLLLLACCVSTVSAEIQLPAVIADNMVLQCGRPVPIWGWAEPGEDVRVAIGGKTAAAKADNDGRWRVTLEKLEAGGPHPLVVEGSSSGKLTVSDVLVGEVWLCSGQSNMAWPVAKAKNAKQEIAAAKYPRIRFFAVMDDTAEQPRVHCTGHWVPCSRNTVGNHTAVGYFFGRALLRKLDVPIGLIQTDWGGTTAEAWTSRKALEAEPSLKPLLERWDLMADTRHRDSPHRPASLYNAMIAPLVPYGIRGVIWYQGESNVARAYQYRTIFPAMIRDWRTAWGQGDFPFGFVQIAPHTYTRNPGDHPAKCAELWEAQLMTLKNVPNTGMVVTTDIGNLKNIHPTNKQEVGRRLALWALAKVYGRKLVYSGPIHESMSVEGDHIRIHFTQTGSGLSTRDGKPPSHFTIAGADKKFHPADARIEGRSIVVHGPSVSKPVAVRFAWREDAEPNLINKEGLPASPFRTDPWRGVTEGRD